MNRPLASTLDLTAIIDGIDLNLPTPPPPGVLPPAIQDIVDGLLQGAASNIRDAVITAIQGADPLPTLDSVEVDLTMAIMEFGLGYRVGTWAAGDEGHVELSLLGGGRYFSAEMDSEYFITPGLLGILPEHVTVSAQRDWIDLMIGGQVGWQIDRHWAIGVRGDVGGFGIGSSSELTWNLLGVVRYRLNSAVSLVAGYRVLDIDYESGSGADAFVLDAQMFGPVFGAVIRF